ncbi:hypothetical protein EON63_20530 [archaeon]|nr:MAG: hypothetical protein EON63_20530 [archaeon]
MQNTTGVVYATSFPALDSAVEEVTKYFNTKSVDKLSIQSIIQSLRTRLLVSHAVNGDAASLSQPVEEALQKIQELCTDNSTSPVYEFDRKFLFRVLVLGNAQLAQIIKAKGPNMQTNAACAGMCHSLSYY